MSSSADALVVTSGPLSGQTLPLERRELVVGRDAACDVPLTPYGSISRRHARLTPDAEGWKIEDLGSTNGIYLDGARIQEGILKHGSRLRLGDFEALVRVYTAPPPVPTPPPTTPSAPQFPLVPPPIPESPSVAPTIRKNQKLLWGVLGVGVLLVGTALFFGGRTLQSGAPTASVQDDKSTADKVRRALDNNSPNTQPIDPGTQPTAASSNAQIAPPVNGRIAPATVTAAKNATVLIMHPEGNGLSFGSGFVAGNGHQIITNRHVVANDHDVMSDCIIIFDAGTPSQRRVQVLATSITLAQGDDRFASDLALLTLPDDISTPTPLPLGRSEDLSETDTTWVFGFPLGVGTLTLDQELPSVSVKDATIERVQRGSVDGEQAAKVLQLGSTVTHGNSGGPVLNANGEVVGVISQGSEGTSISYAIPTVWVKRLLP